MPASEAPAPAKSEMRLYVKQKPQAFLFWHRQRFHPAPQRTGTAPTPPNDGDVKIPANVTSIRGTWFDDAIDFRDPEGDAITRQVLALLAASETRRRKRRPADEANHYTIVRKILANGFRCFHHREPCQVAYFRGAEGYTDAPQWLSGKAMSRAVDVLVDAGLLKASIGEWGTASTYEITKALFYLARQTDITDSCLTQQLPAQSLVRLRSSKPEGKFLDFTPTEDTHHWTALLESYNTFLVQQDIRLALTGAEAAAWAKHAEANRDGQEPHVYRPELFRTDLYRVFNNGNFDEGGRLYGGWWIDAPKSLRSKITINGQPTTELDYSGCALRMLYHERGIEYLDDPYRLAEIAAYEARKGLRANHFREAIKKITQALINDGSDGKPERIPLSNGLSFWPDFSRKQVRQMIEDKHAPIADAFGTGIGLRLQRKDSDLALAIIINLMEQGIVALPIHDSFVTMTDKSDHLKKEMINFYRSMFGFDPIIKVST
ncbi:hypothetical protein FHS91_001977 [Sphingobium xanthum]|uniref:hypothetical protein n=2 Tax=Sphingobium xanthum TaxID=1387165 RepID=UPI003D231BE9